MLTKDQNFHKKGYKNVIICHSIEEVLDIYKNQDKDLWVCGGSQVYKQFLPFADKIYLTLIHDDSKKADTFFPEFNLNEWKIDSRVDVFNDPDTPYKYSFINYSR